MIINYCGKLRKLELVFLLLINPYTTSSHVDGLSLKSVEYLGEMNSGTPQLKRDIRAMTTPQKTDNDVLGLLIRRRRTFLERIGISNDLSEASRIRNIIRGDREVKRRPRKNMEYLNDGGIIHELPKSSVNEKRSSINKLTHNYENTGRPRYYSKLSMLLHSNFGTTYHDDGYRVERERIELAPFSITPNENVEKYTLMGERGYG